MSEKHHKHPKLNRRRIGRFHSVEWAIYGVPCSRFDEIVSATATFNKSLMDTLIVDADHGENEIAHLTKVNEKRLFFKGDKQWNEYDDILNNDPYSVALINGNHYSASRQIVIIDSKKKDSLLRRIDQLDALDLIIVPPSEGAIFEFLKPKINAETRIKIGKPEELLPFFLQRRIEERLPSLKAVVLAGGKSSRMGTDKSQIVHHQETMEVHLAKLLERKSFETYISKAYDFSEESIAGFKVIKDRFVGLGPMGAILSAFMTDPNAAWLVLACDLPFVDANFIENIRSKRNVKRYATALKQSESGFPEPLMTIYEPRAYGRLLQFLSLGHSCPRKMLINSDVEVFETSNNQWAKNINTPEERNNVKL